MVMGGTEHLTVRREGATLVLTLDRPEAKNALSLPMLVGLYDGWVEADEDDEVRSIVLTGAGGSFCAGMDLKALAGKGTRDDRHRDRLKADPDLHWKALLRHHRPRKPVIAAVEGHCVAGGTEILQGTDIRVAGESATFGLYEVRRGLFPIGGSALDKALEIAEQVNACGPLAVEAIKASVYETAEMTETDGLASELKRGWPIFDTADAREGARAFAEKRPPVYKRA